MLLVNIDYIPGKEFEVLGIVKAPCPVQNFGKDFMAGMKTLVGGEITGYTEMLNEARQIAVKRMVMKPRPWVPTRSLTSVTAPLPSCAGAARSSPTAPPSDTFLEKKKYTKNFVQNFVSPH